MTDTPNVPDERYETVQQRDELILVALLNGANVRQAAQQSGCSESSVTRRLNDPGFKRRLQQARAAIQERTLSALVSAGPTGVRALLEAAAGEQEQTVTEYDPETGRRLTTRRTGVPWAQRVAAAKALVELSVGTLARVHMDVKADVDLSVAQDGVRDRLAEYRERLGGLRLVRPTDPIDTDGQETPTDPVEAPSGLDARTAIHQAIRRVQ